ncbi:hypothetical protein LMH73_016600 [Vibrio splendidus]|nr:hypothetical protein [Vibrio splendidus]MCC4883001.1 hypothetical protein [Vibrio splendidus]
MINHHFQLTYAHLSKYHSIEEQHIGQWAIENASDSVVMFQNESDAKLASDFILLKPLMMMAA